jgi:hypothetical protein
MSFQLGSHSSPFFSAFQGAAAALEELLLALDTT